jgi:hypothetical protein
MICYMPHTVLGESHLKMLSDALGTLTVYSPADAIVPRHMRIWQQQGKLEIRHPGGVDQKQLLIAIENYKSWADLHQGNIGDMAGFFRSQQGRIPMMDDTNPTQIGHQIRHYGEPAVPMPSDSLFKAALFLSMAQEYDLYQYGMEQDMDAVHVMEQHMLRQLGGSDHEVETDMPTVLPPPQPSVRQTVGDPYMAAHRVKAWARLALADMQVPMLFLTLSKTVADQIDDLFPDALELAGLSLHSSMVQKTLQNLAAGSDIDAFEPALSASILSADNKDQLILYRLAGVSPLEFLHRLAEQEPVGNGAPRHGDVPKNTFIGWVKT